MSTEQAFRQLLDFVTRQYDLASIDALRKIEGDPFSHAYRIESGRGTFCLKRHRQENAAWQLDLEEHLIVRLKESGFALAPHIVPTIDGNRHVEMAGERWSLFDYVASDPPFDWKYPGWTETHCRQAGAGLAELHFFGRSCLTDLKADGLRRRQPVHFTLVSYVTRALDCARSFDFTLPVHKSLHPDSLLSGCAATVRHISEQCADEDAVLIHGDFHPGNLLFADGRLVCLLDYDEARIDMPSADLGYAAVFFCLRWPAGESAQSSQQDGSLGESFLRSLLDGYCCRARELGLTSSLLANLESAGNAFVALERQIKLTCYLAVGWLLGQRALVGRELEPEISRALLHFGRALALLEA